MAAPASAQFAKPEDAIKYRQSALFVMGQHFGRIGAMANGKVPFDAKPPQTMPTWWLQCPSSRGPGLSRAATRAIPSQA